MNSSEQVIFVLQLILSVGPLAGYFLGLGLVNSRAYPCLVHARVDFGLLVVSFVPVVVAPMAALAGQGRLWLGLAVLGTLAGLFLYLWPRRSAGWVIYNIEPRQFRRLLERAAKRLGWTVECTDERIHVSPVELDLECRALPWLRNITVHISGTGGQEFGAAGRRLMEALDVELRAEAMLPSPIGAGLVVAGAALLGLPMWYLFQHIDAVVEVVRQILFA